MEDIKIQIEALKTAIFKYDQDYFDKDESDLDDSIHDQLMAELIELETKYPQYATADSPTKKVGGNHINTFNPVVHKHQMQSLGKVLNKQEFADWFKKMVDDGVDDFYAEFKIDGVALSNEYESNKFIQGATRGNGIVGDDVTATAQKIQFIPGSFSGDYEVDGYVRGESYIKKSDFVKLNEYLISQGKEPVKNARNAASGLIKRKEVSKENEFLSFMAYYFSERDFLPATYESQMRFLEHVGFETSAISTGIKINVEEVGGFDQALQLFEDYFDEVEKNRANLEYDIDGIVIKANNFKDQDRLGVKTNVPNWAIAYKFPAQEGLTTLKEVVWTMGNKGNITPNARLEKTLNLVGADINNVTLHNLNELKKLDIKIGDHIVVSRQGDVIPKVKRVLPELRTGNEVYIEIPSHCPACGAPTVIIGAYLNCSAGSKCSHMNFARIQNFIKAMEIEEFGDVKIKELVDIGLANDIADLYDREAIDFENGLTRVKKKTATKMYNNIQKSRENELWMVINGLTIDGVGTSTAKDLAEKYRSLESFIDCKANDLVTIEGIAEISADKIVEWCKDEENRVIIKKLVDRKIGKMKEKVTSSNKLEGKVFATSGTLSFSRKELEAKIADNGGEFSSIKKGITHFVAGEGAKQPKIDKATGFGAKIITDDEFLNMIK
ncbi:DNA ligase [compost metagenome]